MKLWIRCASVSAAILILASLSLLIAIANTPPSTDPLDSPVKTASDKVLRNPSIIQQQPAKKLYKAENIAFALKTGSETAASRAAIQLLTFLKHAKNVLVVAEATGFRVGDLDLDDVYTNVYQAAKERIKVAAALAARNNETAKILARRALNSDQVIAGQNVKTKGWTLDAHKNLPALHLLHERFPKAEWYVMFDDDSFVYIDNLEEYLSTLDPDEPHYIGQSNRFKGCDGVKVFGQGPRFAQGGAGIVISRGAMKAIASILDGCILRYKTCWAGDIRVGLCMRDAGILVKHKDGFFGIPPNANFQFPNDPCTKPFVFHHSLPHQIQSLYDLQSSKNDLTTKTVTMADIYHHIHFRDPRSKHTFQELRMQNNTDVRGKAINYRNVGTPQECLEICEGLIGECVGWTWDGMTCWTKNGPGKMETKEGMWGGVLAERYVCVPGRTYVHDASHKNPVLVEAPVAEKKNAPVA
ncbi:UNVERIFIED_CONTAM: hypothetical protein HDU68_007558 [Siphonaria sp. JEL0065]|nr:hypothetical protein HDU68_007558 [Siphonaria sp. JEL0065]